MGSISSTEDQTKGMSSIITALLFPTNFYFFFFLMSCFISQDIYDKEKESIVAGERMLLATVAFDLNIEHPYKALVAAMKRLEISNKEMVKVAWNFVNDWLVSFHAMVMVLYL